MASTDILKAKEKIKLLKQWKDSIPGRMAGGVVNSSHSASRARPETPGRLLDDSGGPSQQRTGRQPRPVLQSLTQLYTVAR